MCEPLLTFALSHAHVPTSDISFYHFLCLVTPSPSHLSICAEKLFCSIFNYLLI